MLGLDGRAFLVTGAGRGIGAATARILGEAGASVLINDLDADAAERTAAALRAAGATVEAVGGSVTEPDAGDRLVAATVDAFGRLDGVVNNAGYPWDAMAHKTTDEQFQAMLDIHATAPMRVCRAAYPHFKAAAERGEPGQRKVVNVASVAGTTGNVGQAAYGSAKAAVTGLTRVLAKEWGRLGVNVNAVAFGLIDTRITAVRAEGDEAALDAGGGRRVALGVPEHVRQLATMVTPLGRPGTATEAASAIAFLCSSWSDYVSGQVLTVNGGAQTGMA